MAKKKEAVSEDLEAALGVEPSAEEMAAVGKVVEQAIELERRIEVGEELLKKLNAELNTLKTKTLPDTFARANTSLHKVLEGPAKGWKVEIVPLVAGSLPKVTKNDNTDELVAEKKARRERGLTFLREHDGEDIIKTELTVTIQKGQDNLVGDLKSRLDELGLEYEMDSTVHPKTLASYATERLKKGEEVPFEDLGLYAGRTAKFTAPKD